MRVYNVIAVTTLTYACESWNIQKKHKRKTIASEIEFLKKISEHAREDRERNDHVRRFMETRKIRKIRLRLKTWLKRINELGNRRKRLSW